MPPRFTSLTKLYQSGISFLPKPIANNILGRKAIPLATMGVIGASGNQYEDVATRPDNKIPDYIAIYKKDSRVRSAIDITASYTIGGGWKFMGEDEKLVEKAEALREELKLDMWMENALKVMLITGDCFTEIRKMDGKSSLVILPSEQMSVNRDKYGNIPEGGKEAYSQILTDGTKIPFDYEQILQTYRPYSSEPRGLSILMAAKYAIDCLWELERLMLTITDKFAAPLIIARMGTAEMLPSQQALNEMRNELKKMSIEKNRMWAVPGIIEFQQIESARAALNVSPYLDYFERQVYTALNIPPVLMGKPEGSNRTTSRTMLDAFERYITSLQAVMADSVITLLRRLGFGEVPEIVFSEISPEDESSKILRLQRMLGSDRSTGWITIDEARSQTPDIYGTWADAMNAQSIPNYAEIEKKSVIIAKPKRQQPPGSAPGEPPKQPSEPEEPAEKEPTRGKGERSATRPAGQRGSQTTPSRAEESADGK